MRKIIFTVICLVSTLALAQMPSVDSLKAGANDANAAANSATSTAGALQQKALVNLNTASTDDLAKLPGIGPARAQAIVDGRPYKEISDLKKVKGVKEGVIAKIKGLVTTK